MADEVKTSLLWVQIINTVHVHNNNLKAKSKNDLNYVLNMPFSLMELNS